MIRFVVLLLLSFALRPAVAAASPRPGGGDAEVERATQESPRDALPAAGFEIRTVLVDFAPGRHPSPHGADGPASGASTLSAPRPPTPSRADVRQENGVFSPLCEHLPYHATAPPLPQ